MTWWLAFDPYKLCHKLCHSWHFSKILAGLVRPGAFGQQVYNSRMISISLVTNLQKICLNVLPILGYQYLVRRACQGPELSVSVKQGSLEHTSLHGGAIPSVVCGQSVTNRTVSCENIREFLLKFDLIIYRVEYVPSEAHPLNISLAIFIRWCMIYET